VPYADAMLVPLPDGVDPVAAASVADNVSDGFRHVAPHLPAILAEDADAHVLIVGGLHPRTLFTNSVGLYVGQVARALGGRNVHLVDARSAVRARAEALGLDAYAPKEVRGLPLARLTVDVSAASAGFDIALAHTAPDGVLSSVGGLHRSVRIPMLRTFGRNATVHIGRSHARALIPDVLALMSSGALHPEAVTTLVAPLDDAIAALGEHRRTGAIKTILTA
jgi:alcohol dehydrogenase